MVNKLANKLTEEMQVQISLIHLSMAKDTYIKNSMFIYNIFAYKQVSDNGRNGFYSGKQ